MLIQNVIGSFPVLFTPKAVMQGGKQTGDPRFSLICLIPPNHPQLAELQAAVENVKRTDFPSGLNPRAEVCLQPYDHKFQGKEYYDSRCSGYWVLSANAKAESRPYVGTIDATGNPSPVMDPGKAWSGQLMHVHVGFFSYKIGDSGIGCGLNGVILTEQEGPLGRLDNKPTVDQMFAGLAGTKQPSFVGGAPTPPAPPAPPSAPVMVMTAAANGVTYEAYKAQGWTDDQLIQNGLAVRSSV